MATQDSTRGAHEHGQLPFWMAPLEERDPGPLSTVAVVDALHLFSDQLSGLGDLVVATVGGDMALGERQVQQIGLLVLEHGRQIRQFADLLAEKGKEGLEEASHA